MTNIKENDLEGLAKLLNAEKEKNTLLEQEIVKKDK
jgi:hypothetical protein